MIYFDDTRVEMTEKSVEYELAWFMRRRGIDGPTEQYGSAAGLSIPYRETWIELTDSEGFDYEECEQLGLSDDDLETLSIVSAGEACSYSNRGQYNLPDLSALA